MKPTAAEIKTEIDTLKKMKPKVRQFSMFGDDHHAAIDAQIMVLQGDMDEDTICDRWDGEELSNLRDSALEARQWLDGELDPDEFDYDRPSGGWKELMR
jgi:hypothetical protein